MVFFSETMVPKIIVYLIACCCPLVLATYKLQEHFEWNVLDYEYPSEQARIQALKTARFIPENNLPVGMELWGDKIFVTVPRWRPGIYIHLHN